RSFTVSLTLSGGCDSDLSPVIDFVQGARDVFRLQLDEATSGPGSITLSSGDVSTRGQTAEPVEQVTEGDEGEEDELESVKREWSNAVTEVKKLKEELSESERSRSQLSEELHRVTQEAKSAVEECRALRGRIHVAEAAQRQARGMEMDYEEVIHLLEAEITELKAQLSEQHGQSKARRRYRGDARSACPLLFPLHVHSRLPKVGQDPPFVLAAISHQTNQETSCDSSNACLTEAIRLPTNPL
uniref:Syntaxin-binding protein 4-like n=1 Tax=Callorhinchus milii TaxID=7868 RepID=A0A4W3H3Q8_CALMI